MKRTSFIATTAIASAIILCSQAQAGGLTGSLGGGSLAGSLNGGLVRAGGGRAGVVVIVLEVSISVAVIVKDRKVIGTQQVDDAKVESVLKLKGIGNSNTVPDRPEPTSPWSPARSSPSTRSRTALRHGIQHAFLASAETAPRPHHQQVLGGNSTSLVIPLTEAPLAAAVNA